MKKSFFLILLLNLILSSCDKDATDINFSTRISATSDDIIVNDNTNKSSTNDYDISFVVSLENEDTRQYLDKIKNIELQEVNLIFNGLESLAGNQTPTYLKITVDNDIVLEYSNFAYNLVASGEPFGIEDMNKINEIAQLLLKNKKISVKIEGEIPDTDFHQFNISIDALAKITAETL